MRRQIATRWTNKQPPLDELWSHSTMPDESDTPTPLPLPPVPLSDRELLERLATDTSEMKQWIARVARATGSQALTLKQFAESAGEELGQLHGGLLLIDGTTQRIARAVGADPALAAGGLPERAPRERRRTPTDQFDLPAGVTIEVPKRRLHALLNTWKGLKFIWWAFAALATLGGWGWHLWIFLHR